MSIPTSPTDAMPSTRPYLVRALHSWCCDNGFTPYIAVHVDARVQVPREYVKNSEIVLNIAFEATTGLKLGNEAIEFKARFGGTSRDIYVPIDHVIAIYARENGQGMAFPMPSDGARDAPLPTAPGVLRLAGDQTEDASLDEPPPVAPQPPPAPTGGSPRPALKRIK